MVNMPSNPTKLTRPNLTIPLSHHFSLSSIASEILVRGPTLARLCGPSVNVAKECDLTSTPLSHMSCLSYLNGYRDGE